MVEQKSTNKNKCTIDINPNVNGESVAQVGEYVEVEIRLLQEEDVETKEVGRAKVLVCAW